MLRHANSECMVDMVDGMSCSPETVKQTVEDFDFGTYSQSHVVLPSGVRDSSLRSDLQLDRRDKSVTFSTGNKSASNENSGSDSALLAGYTERLLMK